MDIKNENKIEEKIENKKEIKTDNRPSYRKKRIIVPFLTTCVFLLIGLYLTVYSNYYKTTDDAFIDGHIITVSPRVYGPVLELYIDDNQMVKKGDLLLKIDSSDYEVKLMQGKAKLNEAIASLKVCENEIKKSKAKLKQASNNIMSCKSRYEFANSDYKRYKNMYNLGISSKQEYESSKTELKVATSNLNSAIETQKQASSELNIALAQREAKLAQIEKYKAEVFEDENNLKYTNIYAPVDGVITSKSVEKGNYLQIAEPILKIVPKEIWVTANFKETQIEKMKPGQDVIIKIDTFGGKKFKGKVDSIQRSTGAKTSLFPPENAVGSYVKIVQRVPVKIVFTQDYSKYNIVIGMSVVPKVKVK